MTSTAAALVLAIAEVLFDDFAYNDRKQLETNGWIVRTAAGWPGVPGATWSAASLTLHGGVVRMTASTDGTVPNTKQVQLCHQRKYREGTYAARVRFTDGGTDQAVETFYMISPLREPMAPEYSEIDFEYLPNGGWGRKGATFFTTIWETFHPEPDWKADNVSEEKSASYAGWHTLVVQVANSEVRYFVDGAPFATHGGKFFPESLMSINFNLWFTRHGLAAAAGERKYEQDIDWVFHAKDAVLSPADVEAEVAGLRKKKVAFRDTVKAAKPALESPCNL
jgi:Glycosyl hydrolases family 16